MNVPDLARDHDVAREAQRWHLLLKDPSATEEDRRAFETWRLGHPARARAFSEAERIWAALAGPARTLGADGWHRATKRGADARTGRIALAMAASVAFIALAVWWRYPGLTARAFADYSTPPAGRTTVQLADGSHVLLDGDSAMRVTLQPDARRVTLLRGRAWFDVTPDAHRPFSVSVRDASVRVLGTAFAVEREPESVAVTVERGRVAVHAAGASEDVRLVAGERVLVPASLSGNGKGDAPDRTMGVKEPVAVDTALAWRRGLLVFDHASLETVARELSRAGAGHVLIFDAEVGELRLSGVFSSSDPAGVLAAIETGLGVRVSHIPGVAFIIHR